MQHGLYFDANYTFANNVADNQGDAPNAFAGELNYGGPIADRFNIKQDLGNVAGTRHHRMLLTGVYQLPVGRGRSFLNGGGVKDIFLGGWDLTTVTLLETGPWLTPSICGSADQSNTNVVNRGAVLRPDVLSNDFYAAQSGDHFFNLAALLRHLQMPDASVMLELAFCKGLERLPSVSVLQSRSGSRSRCTLASNPRSPMC